MEWQKSSNNKNLGKDSQYILETGSTIFSIFKANSNGPKNLKYFKVLICFIDS